MKIDRDSYGSVALIYGISIAVAILLLLFVKIPLIVWPSLALLLWFCIWQTAFFRVPRRKRNGNGNLVTSVADGRVVIVEKTVEQEVLNRECMQISVYMNFFDVHSNFWPADGTVLKYEYHPGDHFYASHPKASVLNEHTCVHMKNPEGKEILFKQIAGGFARRISCHAAPGQEVRAGSQCGIIKFGSRIDMFLPLDAKINVKVGDLVRASETILAEI